MFRIIRCSTPECTLKCDLEGLSFHSIDLTKFQNRNHQRIETIKKLHQRMVFLFETYLCIYELDRSSLVVFKQKYPWMELKTDKVLTLFIRPRFEGFWS